MFKKAGNIGFICESLDEIKILINKITQPDFNLQQIHNQQVENVKKYKSNFSVDNVANDLKRQLIK